MAVTAFLRTRFMPHLWCPGCGNGIVMGALLRAVEELGLDRNDVVMISGIGCAARMQGYCDFHTLHTLHGRALAFATGVKLGRPELTILVPMGDGDALAIGGNHFIHAARRNIDLTAIVLNNGTYGMTGGQHSPLTAAGEYSTTAPFGVVDRQFDTVSLARAAGATYVARSTTFHARQLSRILVDAIRHKGFSMVEVLTQCPTYYGRRNAKGDAVKMMEGYRDGTVPVGEGKPGDGRMEIGVFVDIERPEYCQAYAGVVERARAGSGAP
jgi:2-oxoglutarate/2-oxoacid ferredoxin oxidoreductase subunit beta